MSPRLRYLLAALVLLVLAACGGADQRVAADTSRTGTTNAPASKPAAPTTTVGGLRVTTTAAEMGASTTRRINALQWRPHDCLGGNFDDPSTTAAIISCSKAHDWEVAGVVTDMTRSLGIQGPELTPEERRMMSDACFEQARMYLPGLVLESPYSRYAGMTIMPTHESWLAGDRRLACLIAPHSRADLSQPPVPVQSTGPAAAPTVEALPVGTCIDLTPQGWHVVGCASSHTHQVVGNVPATAEQGAQVQTCFDLVAAALQRSPSSDDIELLSAKQDVLAAGLDQLPCVARSG